MTAVLLVLLATALLAPPPAAQADFLAVARAATARYWALPCFRLGVAAAGPVPPEAGRALSLAVEEGGRGYFTTRIRVAGGADSVETVRLGRLLARTGAEVAGRVPQGGRLGPKAVCAHTSVA